MKILIVDDNVAKAGKLVSLLVQSGISRDSIEVAVSAMAARQHLRAERFTLMVLDLLIPQREEDVPSVASSISLIEDVCQRDAFRKPLHIVGFTAFPEAESQAIDQFRRRLWTIVTYDQTSSTWEDVFRHVSRYLLDSESESVRRGYNTDLVVITALQSELDAVLALDWSWSEPEPLDDSTFVRRGTFVSADVRRSVVAACCPRMGSVAAGLLAAKLIGRFSPRFIAMPGICAGVQGKVSLSDVVVFDPAWEWPSGKLTDDEDGGTYLEPSPHQIALSEFVSARAEQLKRASIDWNGLVPSSLGLPGFPKVHIGPGASGSAVVADSQTVGSIRQQHRRLLAVEMEVYGVYAAARSSPLPRPTAVAMKAVCDFADDNKSDTYQTFCCTASAAFLRAFFERYMTEIAELAGT